MSIDDLIELRFNELRQRAKKGALAPDEQAEYEGVKERFARSICAAQNIHLKPEQRARSVFRVAALFRVEITVNGSVQRTATMDVGKGGFSSLLGVSAPPGTEVSFKMVLTAKDSISGRAVVASAERERSGNQCRASFAFRDLKAADANQLEEALFDFVVFRKLTPPAMLLSTPRGVRATRPSAPEVRRAMSTPAAWTPASDPQPGDSKLRSDPSTEEERLTVPAALEPARRERMKSVPELLIDETLRAMRDASEAARSEEVPGAPVRRLSRPGGGASEPAAKVHDVASPVSRAPPAAAVVEKPRAPTPAPAPSTRRVSWSRVLIACAVIGTSMIAASIETWHLAHSFRGVEAVTTPIASPLAALASSPPPAESETPPSPQPPSTTVSIAPPTTPPAAPALPTVGNLSVTVAGRRVFIDGHLVGDGPRTFPVSCGMHKVRIGTKGMIRSIDVPCGSEVVIGRQ